MPDYMFLMESRLTPEQRRLLAQVQAAAQAQETNVYLTGGAVRDLITGMPIRDLDFTVEGSPTRLAHELEKQGARVVEENERLRHMEMVGAGEVDFSLSSARDEVYERPGAKSEARWATIVEDLRRRDFSINAIAISLNLASRGLLLDPTNGLADIEKREVRVLTMHSFTNQPIRLLRILRFSVRLDFKMEPRTAEWFALAMERKLHESLEGNAVGEEIRQLGREEKCVQILKAWEARGVAGVIHPRLPKRHPDYEGLAKLMRAREALLAGRIQPRLFVPVVYYLLGRLASRERSFAMNRMGFRAAEVASVQKLEGEAQKVVKVLKGRKTERPRDAYDFLVNVSPTLLGFILADVSKPRVPNKIRNYLSRWRPLRMAPPIADLESLGVPPGPKFDKIVNDFFYLQLGGKGRNPQDRLRLLRQLAGIKPEPKKKEKEKEKEKETKKKGKGPVSGKEPDASKVKGKGSESAKAVPQAPGAQAPPAGTAPHAVARPPAKPEDKRARPTAAPQKKAAAKAKPKAAPLKRRARAAKPTRRKAAKKRR